MSYKKSNWVPYDPTLSFEQNVTQGGTTTADKLNNMETGISNNDINKVTDNHDGTIFANGASILPANEDVIGRIDGTYTDMNDIPMGWLYLNGWTTSSLSNWGLPQDFYYVHCFKTELFASTTIQMVYGVQQNNTYVRTMAENTWTTWKLIADDSKVAHLSGTETVTGDKNFTGALQKGGVTVPSTTDVSTAVNQTALTAGTDVNTLTTDGVYSFSDIALTNFYSTDNQWGFIQVFNHGGIVWQIAATAAITNGFLVRMESGNPYIWKAWTRVADDSKVAHLSGANNFDTVPTVNNKSLATTDDVATASNTVLTSANTSISKLLQSSSNNDEDSAVTNSTSDTSNFYYWTE